MGKDIGKYISKNLSGKCSPVMLPMRQKLLEVSKINSKIIQRQLEIRIKI